MICALLHGSMLNSGNNDQDHDLATVNMVKGALSSWQSDRNPWSPRCNVSVCDFCHN
jgi:hypothetical protein